MKRSLVLFLTLAVGMWISSVSAMAQRGSNSRPTTTGIEHAESVANPKGADKGIDNAEAKQSVHKHAKKSAKKSSKGKKLAKGKAKTHKRA